MCMKSIKCKMQLHDQQMQVINPQQTIKSLTDHTLGVHSLRVLSSQRHRNPSDDVLKQQDRPSSKHPSLDTTTSTYSHVHAEWEMGHGGISQDMEVEVREEAPARPSSADAASTLLANNTPVYPPPLEEPVVIVRVEEVLLVVLVLMIWVAAIALFFNRWGKIRMLEPYQPKFNQQPHRPSCPLAPLSPAGMMPQQRMSFSKYNVNAMTDPLSALPSPIIRRPRQNSVFVGGSSAILNPPPRRVKSAIDIQHMLINEHVIPISFTSGSVVPILNRDRRPSISIERSRLHRPSITIPPHNYLRRSSCFVERSSRPHRNFISFEHPKSFNMEMKASCSYQQQQPTISFDSYVESSSSSVQKTNSKPTKPEPPNPPTLPPPIRIPKVSRSFEQPPPRDRPPKPERMANSLDVSAAAAAIFDLANRRCSIAEEDRSAPVAAAAAASSSVYICLDETRITAPLLEGLKSSDV